ncbi:MAG TPA: thiamine pyrophosphate-binding protein [Xanthobacteraceae bacterium]|nr:thiamine pyrophosphate-binding protein [Xanthobacteraceae bacterium]
MADDQKALRGADIVVRSLERLGCERIFTLSGNHIMSLFDAALETKLDLVHVRHEAAAVHMADAWGRLTGKPGIAMVTGGPGHANAVGALFTALGAESPMVLLSGHAATWELGRGGFQEIRQADMAAPVSKASFTATSAATLGRDVGEAVRIASSGRPGPVHLSLPSDLLEERVESNAIVWPAPAPAHSPSKTGVNALMRGEGREGVGLSDAVADATLAALAAAARPIILAPPQLSNVSGRALLARLEAATRTPAVIIESPRGIADATLGAFSDLVPRADLIVLIGKALDFTTRWLGGKSFDPNVRLIAIDPEAALVERAAREMDGRLVIGCIADVRRAAETLIARAAAATPRDAAWLAQARAALDNRPAAWANVVAQTPDRLHPAEVFRVLRPYLERDPDTVLICDGGEFAQWGQSMLPVRRRMINGVAGSIGGSLSFANAARLAEPRAPVFVVLGDGTIGFHLAEFETAARRNLPFVAILGNDALWNAESQIQLREYGRERMHGCTLTPARYDLAVAALGGHGELVERAAGLAPAIERALESRKPACINVMIESTAAPVIRLRG